jgi:catechol 2,3-dioxygenase-like lactoylglutathione lyase family enzyme
MSEEAVISAHLSAIEPVPLAAGDPEWRPVRHHFCLNAFGVGLFRGAEPGDFVIEEHDERIDGKTNGHEELYFVVAGHARFVVEGEVLDAPAGTFVAVRDPDLVRSARAVERDTLVLAIGARSGHPFEVSPWERTWLARANR